MNINEDNIYKRGLTIFINCSKSIRFLSSYEGELLKEQYKKLIMSLADKASKALDEIWSLWEMDPSSMELRDKFYVLEEDLNTIRKACEKRI